jgi:hypothetical protein
MFCAVGIMYNRGHGLENDEDRGLRCLRPLLDTAGGAPAALRQSKVSINAVGQGRAGWANPRGAD